MKKLALAGLMAATLTGCSSQEEPQVLNLYNWSEYMDPDLITAFQDQYGVTVTEDFYPSNEEMFGRVEAGGSGYDMIIPSDYMVSILISESMILPVPAAAVPNTVSYTHLTLPTNREV